MIKWTAGSGINCGRKSGTRSGGLLVRQWAAVAALMLIAAPGFAGCGGGAASGTKSLVQYTGPDGGAGGALTGRVTAPAGVSLQRPAGRQASATGLSVKTTAPVFVYKINDDGIPTTTWLASALTNSSGDYSLTIPNGYAAGSNELVGCGSGANLMRAFVTATGTIDISPATEVVVLKVTASAQPLANFSAAEIIAMQTQANTDAANADYTGVTSITAASTALYAGTLKTNLDAAIAAAGAAAKR